MCREAITISDKRRDNSLKSDSSFLMREETQEIDRIKGIININQIMKSDYKHEEIIIMAVIEIIREGIGTTRVQETIIIIIVDNKNRLEELKDTKGIEETIINMKVIKMIGGIINSNETVDKGVHHKNRKTIITEDLLIREKEVININSSNINKITRIIHNILRM